MLATKTQTEAWDTLFFASIFEPSKLVLDVTYVWNDNDCNTKMSMEKALYHTSLSEFINTSNSDEQLKDFNNSREKINRKNIKKDTNVF